MVKVTLSNWPVIVEIHLSNDAVFDMARDCAKDSGINTDMFQNSTIEVE